MKKLITVLLTLYLCISSFAAFGQATTQPNKKFKVGGIVYHSDMFMMLMQKGMKDEAQRLGVDINLSMSARSLDKEIELVRTYMAGGFDGIVIAPISADGSVKTLKDAHDKGLKIVTISAAVKADFISAHVENNQEELGQKNGIAAREYIEKNLGGKAKIAIVNQRQSNPELAAYRTNPFIAEVKKLPGVTIVSEQQGNIADVALKVIGDVLTANPDLNIVYATNEGGTVGAVMAVKNAGRAGKTVVFGVDASDQIASFLLSDDNIDQNAVGQQPYEIGVKGMQELYKAMTGQKTDPKTQMPALVLKRGDKDAINKFVKTWKEKAS